MNQSELNRAVASATGETVATVKRLGFLLEECDDVDEAQLQVIDWDQLVEDHYARTHERVNRETVPR
jgi:hypothetical protein